MLTPDQQAAIVAQTDLPELSDGDLHAAVHTFAYEVRLQLSQGNVSGNAQKVLPRLEAEVQNRVQAKQAAAALAAQAAAAAAAQAAADAAVSPPVPPAPAAPIV